MTGNKKYSVKRHPIAKLPKDPEAPVIDALCQDVLHMRTRTMERITKGAMKASGDFTKEKLADSFQKLARSTGVPFYAYEASVHGKPQVSVP